MLQDSLCSGQIVAPEDILTLEGSALKVACSKAGPTVNGCKIKEADIIATNGIIHVMHDVFIPVTGRIFSSEKLHIVPIRSSLLQSSHYID